MAGADLSVLSPPPQPDTPQTLMRLEHAGKWLAWSEDETQILAVGDPPEELKAAAERAGHSRFIYDWVPPVEDRQTTGLGRDSLIHEIYSKKILDVVLHLDNNLYHG